MIELKQDKERVVLVGVELPGEESMEDSLSELSELATTAGAETVGRVIQNREQVHPGDLCWERKDRRNQRPVVGTGSNRHYL